MDPSAAGPRVRHRGAPTVRPPARTVLACIGLALADVTAATWYSGTLGTDAVPGPSLYWIDAVVELPAGVADQLRESLDLSLATEAPDVVADLVPNLPAGELLTGTELDEAFSESPWLCTAYLSATTDQVVLLIIGE